MKKGWETKRLGDLAEIELGKTPARATASFWDDKKQTNNVWLSIADLLSADNNVVSDSKEYLTDKGAALCNIVREGTLLVSFKLTLGRLAFAGRDLFTNEAIAALTLVDERQLSKEYLFWFLQFFDWEKAAEGDVKIKGKTLNKAKLKDIPIEFPATLAEQKRIAGMLDDAFAELSTAQANAEKNLQNARALFESYLQSIFTNRGKAWTEKKLGDLCQIKTGKKDVNQGNPEGKYPFFTCAAEHTYSDVYSFDTEALLVAGNGNVGQVSYYSGRFEAYQRTYVLFDFKGVTAKYLFRVLDKRLSATVGKQKLGNTMPYIKIGMLTDFLVPVPPADEQATVAEHLESFAAETKRLASIYEQKQSALAELKKSLLHQAFSGEL